MLRSDVVVPEGVQTALEAISAYQVLIWIAALIALLLALRKAWPAIRHFVDTVDALGDLPKFMQTVAHLGTTLERVRHQVENDHDENFRDEVTNMRKEVSEILDVTNTMTSRIAELADWQTKHERKSDATVARVAALEKKEKER